MTNCCRYSNLNERNKLIFFFNCTHYYQIKITQFFFLPLQMVSSAVYYFSLSSTDNSFTAIQTSVQNVSILTFSWLNIWHQTLQFFLKLLFTFLDQIIKLDQSPVLRLTFSNLKHLLGQITKERNFIFSQFLQMVYKLRYF